jgi:formylglycine-generating enzyme required for sulfatase activity
MTLHRSKKSWGMGLAMGLVIFLGGVGCDQSVRTTSSSEGQAAGLVPLTNMVRIKAGSFLRMQQKVTLTQDYWLGKFEVTQAEYEALMPSNPSHFVGDPARPVEKVSHAAAVAYCELLTQRERASGRLPIGYEYRLPFEAEWEYACRAGSPNHFSFGDDAALADQYAWTEENSEGSTHPVGLKKPNPWGLHDMHGNVWEWCQDWFAEYPASEATDPVGPPAGEYKVFRGGGWNHEAKFARVASRFMMPPANGIYFVGFRIVLASTPLPAQ